jgi:hypothetical protein
MQTWRRTFATSVARLGHSTTPNSRPALLRCAQILRASKKERPCSLEDQEVKVNGFIRSVRKQKRFAFAEISDGSTIEPVQAILKPAQAAEYVVPRSCERAACLLQTRSNVIIAAVFLPVPPSRSQGYGKLARLARSRHMSFKQPT